MFHRSITKLWPLLLGAVGFFILTSLSAWQAHSFYTTQRAVTAQNTPPTAHNKALPKETAPELYVRVPIKIDLEKLIIIDQIRNKHNGFEVLALAQHKNSKEPFLVALGWTPSLNSTSSLLASYQHTKHLTGILVKPSGSLLRPHPPNAKHWPKHLAYTDMMLIRNWTQPTLYSYILYTPESSMGKLLFSSQKLQQKLARHLNYCLQFLCFALFCLGYGFWAATVRTSDEKHA